MFDNKQLSYIWLLITISSVCLHFEGFWQSHFHALNCNKPDEVVETNYMNDFSN